MNTKFADKIFRTLFIFVFIVGMAGMPNTRVIAQSPLPELTLEKSASPTTYTQVGDVINYSYVLTNTGSGTLSGPFTVTDDKTAVTCPENITPVELSNTVLFDHFENGNLAQYVNGTPDYVNGQNDFGQAIDLSSGAWLRYNMPGWYQWSTYYDPAGKAGSVDLWVYPKKYDVELVDFNWNYSNTPPSSGGYILHFGINPDGKLTGVAWSSIYGPENNPTQPVIQLPAGNTTIPLNQWAHVAYTWGADGTRLYVNGVEDAFSPDNLYPALNSVNYVYVPYWGFPDIGYMDDLRITASSQTNFGVAALSPGESLTCNGSYTITQNDVDNQWLTNTAQAHAFFGSAPLDSMMDIATVTIGEHLQVKTNFEMDNIQAWGLAEGTPITLSIDDPATGPGEDYSTILNIGPLIWDPNQLVAMFELDGIFNVLPGQVITVSGNGQSRSMTVANIWGVNIDLQADTVSGYVTAGLPASIGVGIDSVNTGGLSADTNGYWLVDIGDLGGDIKPGSTGYVQVDTPDGSTTWTSIHIPNPTFSVRLTDDEVHGYQWPLGASVTLTIDDPMNGIGTDYTDTLTVNVANWDPNQTFVQFKPWEDGFTLKSGMTVAMFDGQINKSYVVTNLVVTQVDPDADTVSGIADSGTQVDVGHIYCDQNGCTGFRRVTAVNGAWIADFAHVGEDSDEQDIVDIKAGMGSEARQCDQDGECTQYGWSVADPRMDVSYEHDWIQIYDFTPGGEVTYTIYDHQGGHALFGPVTGPVDSHGNGWISSNLFHTDLIPGNYITAVNEATGEEVSVLIRNINLDYIGEDDDRVFGTGEPNTTLQLNISTTHDQGFNLTTNVNPSGYWEVDLAAQGHPIDGYRYASANLYDAEGDSIIAQSPWVDAQISTDSFGVTNFSKNADVTFTLYESSGGAVLYGPVALRTEGSGSAWVNLWNQGIDLVPGNYITAYDHTLGFTKSLEVEPFDFIEMNAADDYVSGTAAVGEWVDLHVESMFSNWGLDSLTEGNGQWFRNYGVENYDITEQMWANGWATDDQGNRSHDNTTGLPGLEASIADDWISGFNFSPDRQVRIRIYAAEGGSLLADVLVNAWGDTKLHADYWTHGVDLQAGMYILAEDLETGKKSELTLVHLTFDGVDYDTNIGWGTADPGAKVVVRANHLFDSCEITATATGGNWSADFATCGVAIDSGWDIRAMVFDLEFDATVANAPQPPEFSASLSDDWVNGNNWTQNNTVTIRRYEYENGPAVGNPIIWATDNYGNFNADLRSSGIDLLPGNHITVTDTHSGVVKTLTLPNLTIDYLDPELDIAGGQAPADTRLSLDFNNQLESVQFDMFSESDGTWEANFAAYDFDLRPGSSGTVRISDGDGDAVQVDGYVPNPTFGARPDEDRVEGWQWSLGESVTISIDDPTTTNINPDFSEQATVGLADWNPNETWFSLNFNGRYDLKPGDQVTVTAGNTTKTHTVTSLSISNINVDTDVISGTTDTAGSVDLWICDDNGCVNRNEPVAQNGSWSANFAVPGNENWENGTYDISYGMGGDSAQWDNDGDGTMLGWYAFAYTLHAVPAYPEVHGHDWRWGSNITLIIDNDTDPDNGTLYTSTKNADDNPWCGYPCFDLAGKFELQVGQYVTMTDGVETRTVHVSRLQILLVDIEAETISGKADPGSDVMVNISSQDGKARHTIADTNGNWTVDFSILGNEDFEQFTTDISYGDNGRAIQLNPDGTDDGTLEYWNVDWVAPDTIPLVAALTSLPSLARPEYTTDGWTLYNLLWEPLFRVTDQGLLTPAAASGYTLSADGLVYTITLRSDLHWSDGQSVTAQQYVDGFLRILAPDTMSDYASLLYDIQGANGFNNGSITDPHEVGLLAMDEHTLQITLERPAVYFPQVLAIPGMIPVRTDLIAQYGDAWADAGNFEGTGPYRLVEYDKGHILLEKNMAYHDASTVAFETIGFDIFADMDEAFNAYQRGEVDVLIDAPQSALDNPNFEPERVYSAGPGVIYVGLNTQRTPTDDPLVRQALAAATDRRALLDNVLNMPWLQDATGVIPPEIFGYQGTNVGYGYDLELAKALLAQAGYPDGADLPTIYLYGRPGWAPVLDAIAEQWRTGLGITVETHYFDNPYGEYMHQCLGNPACTYNAYRWGWMVDFFDAKNILEEVFHPDSYFNLMGWDNARYRELIELSRGEQDPAQRLAYLQEAEQILVEDEAVVIPLYFTERVSLVKSGYTTVYGLIPYFDLWNNTHQNQPPVADAGPDHVAFAGDIITLDASASSDPEAGVLTYEWDLDNDGIYDDASGVIATISFNQTGDHLIGLRVTDAGGLSATDTTKVTVLSLTLTGFYQPVDMNGVINVVKGGSTVPFKFEIFAGTTELTNIAYVTNVTPIPVACASNASVDTIETIVIGGTSLRYDTAAGQFIYNWKTPKVTNTCYRVTITTIDGSSLVAYFKFK